MRDSLPSSRFSSSPLSIEQVNAFIERGFVRIEECFSRSLARTWCEQACERLYCSLDDRETWPRGRMRPPQTRAVPCSELAPKAWAAACQLIGGEARAQTPCPWTDSFIINFGGEEQPWVPPGPEVKPQHLWHKDGDFFRHFLDSPEQGLLVIALFSDIEPRGGGTFLACDSVAPMARFLAARPEGVLPEEILADPIVAQCKDFVEVTGSIGDVLLMHPYMLHSWSVNESSRPRFIINPPVQLKAPMKFDRDASDPCSAVERAVVQALGGEPFRFVPTAPRQSIVPDRLKRQEEDWEERRRIAQQGTSSH